uniref:Putative zn finger n=1 Tax=Aedes aegypti TaxID=7159 RepID=A0A0P6JRM5_AEDAE
MFNMKLNISDGHSLQWMAKKYFAQFLLIAEYAEEGYFCERCTVQIDMSHAFWREISEKSRRFKLLLRKMTTERVEFSSKVESGDDPNQSECTPEALIIKDEPLDDADMQQYFYNPVGQSRNASMESTITEEKPSLSDPSSIHLVKPPPLKVQLNFKCYVCSSRHESKNALIHHLMMDHQDHSSLNCQECNLSFKNIILFNKHLAMHDPSKRIKCSHCPLRFRKTSARTKHEVARHGVAPPPKNQYMTASATTATAASKDKVKRYPCSQCDKGFMYMSELQRHEKSCSGSFETEDETETGTDLHDEESLPPIYSNDFDAAAETDSDSVADMQQESNNQTPPTTQTSRRSRGRYREPLINDCDCRMKCGSKISVAKQIEINTQFWTLSKKGQQSFILNFSHRRPIKRRQESNFRRLFSYDYQLEDEHGLLQDVCSAFFLNTLGYDVRSSNMIYRYHDRAHAGPAPPSARGKYTRPKALHEAVKDDILTYASISVQDGQSMYLPPSLSYQGMFDSFNERRLQNQEQTCNYSFYCKRLRELNVKKSL